MRELAHSDTDFFTTLAKMEEIKLRKVDEPEFNSLPRGVHLIFVDGKPIFVRRIMGKLMPVPKDEQDRLRAKHIVS